MSKAIRAKKRRTSFDELLMAGISAIADKGIDHVSVSDVAKLSEVSRPTFYTYFGDMPGFFAEIWLRHGMEWLGNQTNAAVTMDEDFNQAMLEVFAIARRTPEVQEVVQPDVEKWWAAIKSEGESTALRMVWLLGFKLGYQLTHKVTPQAKLGLPALQMINFPDDVLELPIMKDLGEMKLDAVPNMPGLSLGSETVDEALTRSALEVVASSGVAATSMTRIARKARVSTGSVYPRFKSAESLIEKSFEVAIAEIVAKNVEVVTTQGMGADQYAFSVNAGFGPERTTWRNYRSEMHLEAAHNPGLAKFMEPGLEVTASFLEENFKNYGATPAIARAVAWFMHSHAIGTSLIFNQVPEVGTQDNRIMTRWVISQLPK